MRAIGAALATAWLLTTPAAGAADGEVRILRGKGSSPPPRAAAAAAPVRVVAGERLWLVDEAVGELVACRLERTSRAGALRIRCAERRLVTPHGP
jgi:hypothetical protein